MQFFQRSSVVVLALLWFNPLFAFDSGSTGVDGVFNPTVDTEVALPPDGIFNFTEVTIPAGVTVTFTPNALNTPVTILVSGDATIDGTIDVSGFTAAPSVGAGDGNVGDDGLPGRGGPGGFAGGRGGPGDPSDAEGGPRMAQSGLGPGGGIARPGGLWRIACYGSGGSFATQGEISTSSSCGPQSRSSVYGNPDLLPLVGGSGGSGGHGGAGTLGSGGGGGGGALLVAVSGTLTINGAILANGGAGGDLGHDSFTSNDFGTIGGGGSGGGVRLIASTISGNGNIRSIGGRSGSFSNTRPSSADGGDGRIRLEAENLLFSELTDPPFTASEPGDLFVSGLPEIRITSVAGIAAPATPTGNADIILPSDTPNPVEVVLGSVNVPLGNTLTVIVTPPAGEPVEVISTALQGTEPNGIATASVNLPDGGSVLLATLSFSVTDSNQRLSLSRFTDGEPVAKVQLAASMTGETQTILTTESGRAVVVQQPAS